MDELDEKELESVGMHIENDGIDDLADEEMDPETGLPIKKPVVPDVDEEEEDFDEDDDAGDTDSDIM